MKEDKKLANRRVEHFLGLVDIPDSYYQAAIDRYHAFGDWLHRPESTVARYEPAVSPQGSFRLGTVNKPVLKRDVYDLDLVVEMQLLAKGSQSQQDLKRSLGEEVAAYAKARSFNKPPTEKNRCWRLEYADEPKFHMDILPAVPDERAFKEYLQSLGVPQDFAETAIAITDKRHAGYALVGADWPRSNPRGFAKWFEQRMRPHAIPQLELLVKSGAYRSIDDIPLWQWKTPLQRAIQFMKRHRDVMFKDRPEFIPISIIITTLAAHAYRGEGTVYEALSGIVERMPSYLLPNSPRVPNPTNPNEDFADAWSRESRYQINFWGWHSQLKADVAALAHPLTFERIQEFGIQKMQATVDFASAEALANQDATIPFTSTPRISPVIGSPAIIQSAPKPWSDI